VEKWHIEVKFNRFVVFMFFRALIVSSPLFVPTNAHKLLLF